MAVYDIMSLILTVGLFGLLLAVGVMLFCGPLIYEGSRFWSWVLIGLLTIGGGGCISGLGYLIFIY